MILAAEQIVLELEFDLGRAETHIPDIGAIGVIDAAFARESPTRRQLLRQRRRCMRKKRLHHCAPLQ
jgi:hypothetical protein